MWTPKPHQWACITLKSHWSVLHIKWVFYPSIVFYHEWVIWKILVNLDKQIFRITFVNVITNVIAIGRLSSLCQWIEFSFLLESSQILSLTTYIVSYFPWNDRFHLFIFEKMSVRYPKTHGFCVSFKNKKAWFSLQLGHKNFSSSHHYSLSEMLNAVFPLIT